MNIIELSSRRLPGYVLVYKYHTRYSWMTTTSATTTTSSSSTTTTTINDNDHQHQQQRNDNRPRRGIGAWKCSCGTTTTCRRQKVHTTASRIRVALRPHTPSFLRWWSSSQWKRLDEAALGPMPLLSGVGLLLVVGSVLVTRRCHRRTANFTKSDWTWICCVKGESSLLRAIPAAVEWEWRSRTIPERRKNCTTDCCLLDRKKADVPSFLK